jgi:general secretion pathway protein K
MKTGTSGGFALIIVLWAGVLLSVIAASFALSMRTETRLAGNLVEDAQAGAIADAGIRRGIVALLAEAPDLRWVSDGRIYELPFGGGRMRIRMVSENGKIDLNHAPEELIEGLLSSLAESGELSDPRQAARIAAAILDWRDADHWIRVDGAEDQNYKAGGLPLGARDGAFLSVDELTLVFGVGADIHARLAPFVSVYSWTSQVDPITAPRQVLRAVPGLDADSVDRFIAVRNVWQAGDGDPSHMPLGLLSAGIHYLSLAKSSVYTIDAVGESAAGTRVSRRALIRLTGRARQPFAIVAWFESIPDVEADILMRAR